MQCDPQRSSWKGNPRGAYAKDVTHKTEFLSFDKEGFPLASSCLTVFPLCLSVVFTKTLNPMDKR